MTAAALLLWHNPLQLGLYQCKYWVLIPVSKKKICKQRKRKKFTPSAGSSSKSSKQELLNPYWNRNKSWIQVYLFCFVFPHQSNKRKFAYKAMRAWKCDRDWNRMKQGSADSRGTMAAAHTNQCSSPSLSFPCSDQGLYSPYFGAILRCSGNKSIKGSSNQSFKKKMQDMSHAHT
jgi:hypothetical protein